MKDLHFAPTACSANFCGTSGTWIRSNLSTCHCENVANWRSPRREAVASYVLVSYDPCVVSGIFWLPKEKKGNISHYILVFWWILLFYCLGGSLYCRWFSRGKGWLLLLYQTWNIWKIHGAQILQCRGRNQSWHCHSGSCVHLGLRSTKEQISKHMYTLHMPIQSHIISHPHA